MLSIGGEGKWQGANFTWYNCGQTHKLHSYKTTITGKCSISE